MPTITTLYPSVSGGGTSLPATSSAAISAAAAAASAAEAAASAVEAANSAILAAPVATSLLALGATSSMNATAVGALNTAISTAFASGVRRIDGLDRTYTITGGTGLIIPQGMEFYNFGIDASGMDSNSEAISVIGTQGSGVLLTANATIPTRTISVASTTGFARGDLVYIYDTTAFQGTTTQGELNRIIETSGGTTITLENPVSMSFTTAATARIAKLTSPTRRTIIRDGYLLGGADNSKTGQAGIFLQYCDGVDVRNIDSNKFGYGHIEAYRSMDVSVINPSLRRATDTGLAYGVIGSFGSRGLRVIGGSGSDMRHFFTTGGGSAGGVNIDMYVEGVTTRGMTSAALDCHPSTINAHFANNQLYCSGAYGSEFKEGITMQGINMRVTGNTLRGSGGTGIYLQALVTAGPYFGNGGLYEISDNVIEDNTGIGAYIDASSANIGTAVIRGNRLRNCDVGNSNAAVYVRATSGKSINSVIVENNHIDTASRGIYIRSTGTSSSIDTVREFGNTLRTITNEGVFITTDASGVMNRVETGGGSAVSTSGNAARYILAAASSTMGEVVVLPAQYKTGVRAVYALATGASAVMGNVTINGGTSRSMSSENFYAATASGGTLPVASFSGCDADGGTNGMRTIGVGTVITDGTNVFANNTARSITTVTTLQLGKDIGVTLPAAITIAAGVATVSSPTHSGHLLLKIDTEAAAATDDLDTLTITGVRDQQVVTLRANSSSRDVVVKDGTGNFKLNGDFTLNNHEDTITLIYHATDNFYTEISRSDNGA